MLLILTLLMNSPDTGAWMYDGTETVILREMLALKSI